MRRSSSIRFLSAVIGETSVTNDNIKRTRARWRPAFNEKQIRRRTASQTAACGFVQPSLCAVRGHSCDTSDPWREVIERGARSGGTPPARAAPVGQRDPFRNQEQRSERNSTTVLRSGTLARKLAAQSLFIGPTKLIKDSSEWR